MHTAPTLPRHASSPSRTRVRFGIAAGLSWALSFAAALAAPVHADEAAPAAEDGGAGDGKANERVGARLKLRGPEGFFVAPVVGGMLYHADLTAPALAMARSGVAVRVGRQWRALALDGIFGYAGQVVAPTGGSITVRNAVTAGIEVQPVLLASADRRTRLDLVVGGHLVVDIGSNARGLAPAFGANAVALAVDAVVGVGLHHTVVPQLSIGVEAGVDTSITVDVNNAFAGAGTPVAIGLFAALVGTFHVVPPPPPPPPPVDPKVVRAKGMIAAPPPVRRPEPVGPPRSRCELQAAAPREAALVDALREIADAASMGQSAAQGAREVAEQARQQSLVAAGEASARYVASITDKAPKGNDALRKASEAAHREQEDAARRAGEANRDWIGQTGNLVNLRRLLDRARARLEDTRAQLGKAPAVICPTAPQTCVDKRSAVETQQSVAGAFAAALAEAAPDVEAAREAEGGVARARDAALRDAQAASQKFLDSISAQAPTGDAALRAAADEAHARFEEAARQAEGAEGLVYAEAAKMDVLKAGLERARLRTEDAQRRLGDCLRTAR